MTRCLAVALGAMFLGIAGPAVAQSLPTQSSGAGSSRLHGIVRDETGKALNGVSVLAFGSTFVSAVSDGRGEFNLILPLGEYVLRAAQAGYLAPFRESIRIAVNGAVERDITLKRTGSADVTSDPGDADDELTELNYSDVAWRLRHLPRTVLRDDAGSVAGISGRGEPDPIGETGNRLPGRAAASFFSRPDFAGQVNLLTTGSIAQSTTGWAPAEFPRGVAYVSLGAPVGDGAWSVRAAMGGGDLSSWTAAGDYAARRGTAHEIRAGFSYSAQALVVADSDLFVAPAASRNVGGVYGSGHWRVQRALDVDYELRYDRYDYLVAPVLLSPRGGVRLAIRPRTILIASLSRRMIAPGADEFLAPSSSGPWLPPERTFSALVPNGPLQAEQVRHYDIGLAQTFFGERGPVLEVRRVSEISDGQLATLFGIDDDRDSGHYYVATVGAVALTGWSATLHGRVGQHVNGALSYTTGESDWTGPRRDQTLRRAMPSAARRGAERFHDVTGTLEASLPDSTHVLLAYRLDSAFAAAGSRAPVVDGRFNLEIRQALPYQPFRDGKVNAVLAVRTLRRDLQDAGAFYDELLSVGAPVRVTCGFQVQF